MRRQQLWTGVLLAVVIWGVSGCGFILNKLPRVKLEPPPAEKTQTAEEETKPVTEEATTATETAAESAATEETEVVMGELPEPAGGGESSGGSASVKYVPVGAQRTLTEADLRGLSKWQLDILRNEIYAAHGRRFQRSDLQQYFDRQTWYQPDAGFTESRLSSREKRNAAFIADYQKRRGQTTTTKTTTTKAPPRRVTSSSGQVLPHSSSQRLGMGDLAGLSKWQLEVARNEIYARHGRSFKRADLRQHFRNQSWYAEDSSFTEGRLSSLEKANVQTILAYEKMQ
jgi:hypothetical protein